MTLTGIITTFLAALGLVYVAFTPHDAFSDWVRVLEYYIPRLSLVIFVEIFAYFFLRLYKSNLDDVKYYQNELINIDAKVLALRSAIMMKDAVLIKSVSEILAKTERNYVLKKGETTTDLELARIESKVSASILDRFSNLANMFSKSRSG